VMPERLQQVNEVLAAALERKAADRSTYLDQACAEPSLQSEVESVIAAHDQADSSFMQRPPIEKGFLDSGTKIGAYEISPGSSSMPDPSERLATITQLTPPRTPASARTCAQEGDNSAAATAVLGGQFGSRYRVICKLGEGGMGTVYALMFHRSRCLLACVFVLLFASAGLAQTPQPARTERNCSQNGENTLELRTAKFGLYYDLVGQAIAKFFNSKELENKEMGNNIRHIQAVCGGGSAENIQKLSENENPIPFAIVQSDVAHAAWYWHPRTETCPGQEQTNGSPSSDLFVCRPADPTCTRSIRPVVITPLYVETMHILIRPHLNILTLQDLKGRRVWVGSDGSGDRFSAERILSAAGVPFCDVIPSQQNNALGRISQKEAFQQLGEMKIDAVFFTGPVPTHQLEDALDEFPEIHFYSLPYDLVHKLTLDESYTEALIRTEDYGKPDSTLTVGVEALLMTNEKADRKDVVALAEFIHNYSPSLRDILRDILETQKAAEHEEEIKTLIGDPQTLLHRLERWQYFKSQREITRKVSKALDSSAGGDGLYLTYEEQEALKDYMENEEAHDGVARLPLLDLPTPDALVPDFYSGDPAVQKYFSHPRGATWKRQLAFVLGACLLLLTSLFVWMRRKLHRVLVRHPDAVLVAIATVLVWALGSYLLYHYEALVNEDFNPLWKSFGTIFLYFIPFFGKTALTPNGQQTILVLKWLGVLLVGGFLSPLIRKMMAADLRGPFIAWLQGRPLMQKDITGHIVIVNWDGRGREIVRQLRKAPGSAERAVVVLTPARVDFSDDDCLGDVIGVVGDSTQGQCLEKARIAFAHSVTILSAWEPSDQHDRRRFVDRDVADTKTIQTLRAIRDLCAGQELPPRLAATAEIRSSSNRREAEHAAGDIIQLEVVCVDALANDVLVQSALSPGLATLYSHLMCTAGNGTPNDTEVFRMAVPRELLGKSFGEILDYFSSLRRNRGIASIPVGVCRASQVFVNPSDEKLGRLQEGDVLFVITERPVGKSPATPAARATGA
jgi:uncharacterized protein